MLFVWHWFTFRALRRLSLKNFTTSLSLHNDFTEPPSSTILMSGLDGGRHALGEKAFGIGAIGEETLGMTAIGEEALGMAVIGEETFGMAAIGDMAFGMVTFGSRALTYSTSPSFERQPELIFPSLEIQRSILVVLSKLLNTETNLPWKYGSTQFSSRTYTLWHRRLIWPNSVQLISRTAISFVPFLREATNLPNIFDPYEAIVIWTCIQNSPSPLFQWKDQWPLMPIALDASRVESTREQLNKYFENSLGMCIAQWPMTQAQRTILTATYVFRPIERYDGGNGRFHNEICAFFCQIHPFNSDDQFVRRLKWKPIIDRPQNAVFALGIDHIDIAPQPFFPRHKIHSNTITAIDSHFAMKNCHQFLMLPWCVLLQFSFDAIKITVDGIASAQPKHVRIYEMRYFHEFRRIGLRHGSLFSNSFHFSHSHAILFVRRCQLKWLIMPAVISARTWNLFIKSRCGFAWCSSSWLLCVREWRLTQWSCNENLIKEKLWRNVQATLDARIQQDPILPFEPFNHSQFNMQIRIDSDWRFFSYWR